eukprot:217894-Hanusia_phi.AAC.1
MEEAEEKEKGQAYKYRKFKGVSCFFRSVVDNCVSEDIGDEMLTKVREKRSNVSHAELQLAPAGTWLDAGLLEQVKTSKDGRGNERIEFWKYHKMIGEQEGEVGGGGITRSRLARGGAGARV